MRVEICVGRMASYPVQPQNLKNIKICKKKKEENTELHKQPKCSAKVCKLDVDMGEVEGHELNVKSCFFFKITQQQIHTFLWVAVMPVWKKCAEKNI